MKPDFLSSLDTLFSSGLWGRPRCPHVTITKWPCGRFSKSSFSSGIPEISCCINSNFWNAASWCSKMPLRALKRIFSSFVGMLLRPWVDPYLLSVPGFAAAFWRPWDVLRVSEVGEADREPDNESPERLWSRDSDCPPPYSFWSWMSAILYIFEMAYKFLMADYRWLSFSLSFEFRSMSS